MWRDRWVRLVFSGDNRLLQIIVFGLIASFLLHVLILLINLLIDVILVEQLDNTNDILGLEDIANDYVLLLY